MYGLARPGRPGSPADSSMQSMSVISCPSITRCSTRRRQMSPKNQTGKRSSDPWTGRRLWIYGNRLLTVAVGHNVTDTADKTPRDAFEEMIVANDN